MGNTRVSEKVGVRDQDTPARDRSGAAAVEPIATSEALDDDETFEYYYESSDNPFRDSNSPNADLKLLKSDLGIEIIRILDNEGLSTRQAEERTGVSHSEFSRIRRPSSGRFTVDRLMIILEKLGYEVKVSVAVTKDDGAKRGPILRRFDGAPVQGA